jgi:hypothetical protein
MGRTSSMREMRNPYKILTEKKTSKKKVTW